MSVEEDIGSIKKEVVKSHNLIIKTDNLVKNLSAEIRQIQKKQEGYERKYWFNSAWAYVIFAALAFSGVYIAFDAKIGAVNREKEELEEKLVAAQADSAEKQQKLSVRSQQEKVAEDLLRLKRENRDEEALRIAEGLDPNRLSPVLSRLVSRETEELRQKLGRDLLESGRDLIKRGHLKRGLQDLDKGLAVKPPPEILAEIQRQRGELLLKLNKSAQAAAALLEAVEAAPKADWADNALYQAGGSLENSGDIPRALAAYRRFLTEYANSRYAAAVKRRVSKLERSKDKSEPATDAKPKTQAAADSANAPAPETEDKPAATSAAAIEPKPESATQPGAGAEARSTQ